MSAVEEGGDLMRTIKKGDTGADVARWQVLLAGQGFDPGGVDGDFGMGTSRATREFQRAHGLEPDGIVGRRTWAAAEAASTTVATIRTGSRGAAVQQWQQLLTSRGFDTKGTDGIFGSGTEQATKDFQQANGLRADGVVGPKTWSVALGADVTPPLEPKPPQGSGFLKDRIDLRAVSLAPAARAQGRDRGVVRTWNRYGGLLAEVSAALHFDPDSAAAVLAIESGGTGLTSSGPVIRFENHLFWNLWGKNHQAAFNQHFTFDSTKRWRGHKFRAGSGAWQKCHQNQAGEWKVYTFAAGLSKDAATRSISIGLAQILGGHAKRIGYSSPTKMLAAFATGEGPQILGFFDFVETDERLLRAIQTRDWNTFARFYNGAGKFKQYGAKMKSAYDQLRAAK